MSSVIFACVSGHCTSTDEEIEIYLNKLYQISENRPLIAESRFVDSTSKSVMSDEASTNKEELPDFVLPKEVGIIKDYGTV